MLRLAMLLLTTPYIVLETDSSEFIVIARRTSLEYPDLSALSANMEMVCRAFDEAGRERKKLLVDLRDGPRRNDPQFEEAMERLRPRIFRGFRGSAVLVRTAVGALQVKRHIREDGAGAEVFHDEHEALEYLRGQSVRGEVPSGVLASRRASRSQMTARVEAPVARRSSRPPPPVAEPEPPESGDSPPTRPSRF